MKIDYEMIMCVVNAGYSNEAMTIAKNNGATGGTVIHARGTGSREMESILNLTYNPEKDMLFIVVDKKIVNKILTALYDNLGLNSDAKGIAFSLPVFSQVGMLQTENHEE